MAGCFETETDVAACDDDSLAGVLLGGVWRDGEKLGAQKCEGRLHIRHLGGLISILYLFLVFVVDGGR